MNLTDAVIIRSREKKKQLFRTTIQYPERPHIRPFTHDDLWILWGAYDLGSFPALKRGMQRKEFEACVMSAVLKHQASLLIEDNLSNFSKSSKRGAVGFISIKSDGWKIEPWVDFFAWASPRRKLRACVAFFQWCKNTKEAGVCVVTVPKNSIPLMDKMKNFVPLFPIGRIPFGSPDGDQFMYSIKCGLSRSK